MMEVLSLARYIESTYGEGRYTHDKDFRVWLQKTMYYIQCYSLTVQKKPFFEESLCAFPKGPMITRVHDELKLPLSERSKPKERIDCVPFFFIDAIISCLSKHSGEQMSTISHTSLPWKSVWAEGDVHPEITVANIKENFGKTEFEKVLVAQIQKSVVIAENEEKEMIEMFEKMEKLQGKDGMVVVDWEK